MSNEPLNQRHSQQINGDTFLGAHWSVWRQDDSGTRFLVQTNLNEQQAKSMVADFEARGHKQAYWCSSDTVA